MIFNSPPNSVANVCTISASKAPCNCAAVKPEQATLCSISNGSSVANTPTFSTPTGSRRVISSTCSEVTCRLLGANTNPTASAPASTASSASSTFVFAQILTHMANSRPRPTTPATPHPAAAFASATRQSKTPHTPPHAAAACPPPYEYRSPPRARRLPTAMPPVPPHGPATPQTSSDRGCLRRRIRNPAPAHAATPPRHAPRTTHPVLVPLRFAARPATPRPSARRRSAESHLLRSPAPPAPQTHRPYSLFSGMESV